MIDRRTDAIDAAAPGEVRMVNGTRAQKIGAVGVGLARPLRGPIDRVYAAFTEPEQLLEWLYAERNGLMMSCIDDLRVGGQTVCTWEGLSERGITRLTFTWLEIEAPTRLVSRQVFSDWPEGAVIVDTRFEAVGERSLYRASMSFATRDIRDAVFSMPLIDELAEALTRLDARLAAEISATNPAAAPRTA